ncbi:hypothetical protein C0992_004218 [Termitomyces sp. T32_za158]|nr:hypothetical protein C0992_004218 [Termitomyces sp. T32_za158]
MPQFIQTRSGATFSPFTIVAIENPTFNLKESVQDALEQINYEDDASLASPPIDPDATLFWGSDAACSVVSHSSAVLKQFTLSESSHPSPRHSGCNARVHGKRAKKRAAKLKAEGLGHHAPQPKTIETHVVNSIPIKTKLRTEFLPQDSSGYHARGKRPGEGVYFRSLEALLDDGYRLIEWDGMPLTCSEGRVFAVLVGQPQKSEYSQSCELAYEAIMKEGCSAQFSDKETHHCRGAFNLWAPKLHQHFRNHLDPLFTNLTYLHRIFPKSVFPSVAFNFGGNVFTKAHRDCMNSAIGWCAIHALGRYDSKQSSHLVLPDLKLIIEFPPGALILIPSATLTHTNLPVVDGESRISFTQYCTGGLFRYVINGYRTETQLEKQDLEEYARVCGLKDTQWADNTELYSFLQDLKFER